MSHPEERPDNTDRRSFHDQWSASFAPRDATTAFAPAAPPRNVAPPVNSGWEDSADPRAARPAPRAAEFRRALFALTPRIIVTPILLAVNVLVYLLMVVKGVSPTNPPVAALQHWGANSGLFTLVQDQWWRLLTCAFLHVGLMHIGMNMFVLYLTGPFVERLLGHTGFLIAYLVAGLTGSLASSWYNPVGTSAGASGAIFGLYGALIGFVALRRDSIPRSALFGLLRSAVLFVGLNIVLGMGRNSHVDNSAHVGGLLGGLLVGLILSQPLQLATGRARRRARNTLAAVVGAAVVAGGIASLRQRVDFPTQVEWVEYLDVTAANAIVNTQIGRLNGADLMQKLDREVLPPWVALQRKLAGVREAELAAVEVPLLEPLRQYMSLRQAEWSLLIDSSRLPRDAKRLGERRASFAKGQQADQLRVRLDALITALREGKAPAAPEMEEEPRQPGSQETPAPTGEPREGDEPEKTPPGGRTI